MSQRFCRSCQGWHDLDQPWPTACFRAVEVKRSSLPGPMLISDTMPECEHVDGKFYTSKSAYRAVTKANGLVEVGNDTSRFKRPAKPDTDKAIDTAIERAVARAS